MTEWTIDKTHSGVHFSVRHMMITTVRGEFQKVSGTVEWDPSKPENLSIQADIDATSINTRDEKRDSHLRSPEFLDVEKHPTISFRSRTSKRSSPERLAVTGDLTIRGITRPVTLEVENLSQPARDPFGNLRVGTTATTKINRSDFDIRWNAPLEAGGLLLSDEILITIDVSLLQGSRPS